MTTHDNVIELPDDTESCSLTIVEHFGYLFVKDKETGHKCVYGFTEESCMAAICSLNRLLDNLIQQKAMDGLK
jgi:hypothetical protein